MAEKKRALSRVGRELEAIRERNPNGMLDVHEAHEWAEKNPNSYLHRALEWDDGKAAREYRYHQIRRLVAIHMVFEDGRPRVISLSIDRTSGGGYRSYDDVATHRDFQEIMLADALQELDRMQFKFARVQELVSVWSEVKKVKRKAAARGRRRKKAA